MHFRQNKEQRRLARRIFDQDLVPVVTDSMILEAKKSLSLLTGHQRNVYFLKAQGLYCKEIGARLGTNAIAVDSTLDKGRRNLIQKLARQGKQKNMTQKGIRSWLVVELNKENGGERLGCKEVLKKLSKKSLGRLVALIPGTKTRLAALEYWFPEANVKDALAKKLDSRERNLLGYANQLMLANLIDAAMAGRVKNPTKIINLVGKLSVNFAHVRNRAKLVHFQKWIKAHTKSLGYAELFERLNKHSLIQVIKELFRNSDGGLTTNGEIFLDKYIGKFRRNNLVQKYGMTAECLNNRSIRTAEKVLLHMVRLWQQGKLDPVLVEDLRRWLPKLKATFSSQSRWQPKQFSQDLDLERTL